MSFSFLTLYFHFVITLCTLMSLSIKLLLACLLSSLSFVMHIAKATLNHMSLDAVRVEIVPHVCCTGPCSSSNGGCSQFCWTTENTSRTCDCGIGFFLSQDAQTCDASKCLPNIGLHSQNGHFTEVKKYYLEHCSQNKTKF